MKQGVARFMLVLAIGPAALHLFTVPLRAAQSPPDPGRIRDAVDRLSRQTRDVNQGTAGLGRDIQNGMRQLQKLARGIKEVENDLKKAKDKADEAAKLAKEAKDAAMQCDKAKFNRLKTRARNLIKESGDLRRNVENQTNVDEKLKDHIQNLRGDRPMAEATSAGLTENTAAVADYQRARANLEKEIEKQKDNLENLEKGQKELDDKLAKTKQDTDPADAMRQADGDLQDGDAWLQENCPPKTGLVPTQSTDMYAFVPSQQNVLACFAPGQNSQEAAKAVGLGNYQMVASGPGGTMIRGPGNPQTVNRLAQDRKITLCFPAEADVCIIMTPLTPFRGHDHEAHSHRGRGVHDHEGSDPPLDWGVTPPQTIIRWEAKSP